MLYGNSTLLQAWLIRFLVYGNIQNPSRISGVHSTPKLWWCWIHSNRTQDTGHHVLDGWVYFWSLGMDHTYLLRGTSLSWPSIGALGTTSWKFPNKPGDSRCCGEAQGQGKTVVLQKPRAQRGSRNRSKSETPPPTQYSVSTGIMFGNRNTQKCKVTYVRIPATSGKFHQLLHFY